MTDKQKIDRRLTRDAVAFAGCLLLTTADSEVRQILGKDYAFFRRCLVDVQSVCGFEYFHDFPKAEDLRREAVAILRAAADYNEAQLVEGGREQPNETQAANASTHETAQ